MERVKAAGRLALEAFQEWVQDRCDGLAAAMAFNAVLAAPTLMSIPLRWGARIFGDSWTRDYILPVVQSWVGPRGEAVLRFMLAQTEHLDAANASTLNEVGIIGLVVGASGFFLQMQDSLETVWNIRREAPGIRVQLKKRLKGLLYAAVSAVILLGGLSAQAGILSLLGWAPRNMWAGQILRLLGIMDAFLTFWFLTTFWFKTLPPVRLTWRQILPWSAFIAVLHLVGRSLLTWHTSKTAPGQDVDLAASLILVIMWFYYSNMAFLYGAQLMRVYLQHHGVHLPPGMKATRLGEQ
jgi:membrane protein